MQPDENNTQVPGTDPNATPAAPATDGGMGAPALAPEAPADGGMGAPAPADGGMGAPAPAPEGTPPADDHQV